MWTHYTCAKLQEYYIIALTNSNRKYSCIIQSYENYDELLSDLKEDLTAEKEDIKEDLTAEKGEIDQLDSQSQTVGQVSPPVSPDSDSIVPEDRPNSGEVLSSIPDIDLNILTQTELTNTSPASQVENSGEITTRPTRGETEAAVAKNKIICRYYRTNSCRHHASGKGCKYAYPKPCPKLLNFGLNKDKGCNKGKQCTNYHTRMCYMSLNEGVCDSEMPLHPHYWDKKDNDTTDEIPSRQAEKDEPKQIRHIQQ